MIDQSDNLKKWRRSLNLTQEQMALYVGVPFRTWYGWESGTRALTGVGERLCSLLRFLEVAMPVYTDAARRRAVAESTEQK